MCHASLVAYAVGGAFLSLAYFDLPYNFMVLVVVARKWVEDRGWEREPRSVSLAAPSEPAPPAPASEIPPIVSAFVPLFRLLSPSGRRARLSTLRFHRVLPEPDPLFPALPDAARFREILSWLRSWFNVLPLSEAVGRLATGTLPDRAAAITFDDGYADNFTVALPLLRECGLTATFFIATGFLDGACMFNDRIIEAIRGCPLENLDLDSLGLGRHVLLTPRDRRTVIETLIDRIKYLPAPERLAISERVATMAGVKRTPDLMMSSRQVRELRRAGMQIGAHTVSHPILTKLIPNDARREIAESDLGSRGCSTSA